MKFYVKIVGREIIAKYSVYDPFALYNLKNLIKCLLSLCGNSVVGCITTKCSRLYLNYLRVAPFRKVYYEGDEWESVEHADQVDPPQRHSEQINQQDQHVDVGDEREKTVRYENQQNRTETTVQLADQLTDKDVILSPSVYQNDFARTSVGAAAGHEQKLLVMGQGCLNETLHSLVQQGIQGNCQAEQQADYVDWVDCRSVSNKEGDEKYKVDWGHL